MSETLLFILSTILYFFKNCSWVWLCNIWYISSTSLFIFRNFPIPCFTSDYLNFAWVSRLNDSANICVKVYSLPDIWQNMNFLGPKLWYFYSVKIPRSPWKSKNSYDGNTIGFARVLDPPYVTLFFCSIFMHNVK